MSFNKKLEFGNFTVKFGDKHVLLDLLEEVVLPSFQEMRYRRAIKDRGTYFFLDTTLVKLNNNAEHPSFGIYGKIVKNTILRRDQIYREGQGIIEDAQEMETAPTSVFLLILNNHRLIFCREVVGAPTLDNFQSTCQSFLTRRHREFLEGIVLKNKQERVENPEIPRITKVKLVQDIPYPEVRITPLTGEQELEEFIKTFEIINEVTIKLLPTNNEDIDNDEFWADFGRRKENMNSGSATVRFSNSKEGLNEDAVMEECTAASGLGNSEIKIVGADSEGDTIRGNNEDFSLTIDLDNDLPSNPNSAAQILYNTFMNLSQRNVIKLPTLTEETWDKIRNFVGKLF